jgi:hypothetical protein
MATRMAIDLVTENDLARKEDELTHTFYGGFLIPVKPKQEAGDQLQTMLGARFLVSNTLNFHCHTVSL